MSVAFLLIVLFGLLLVGVPVAISLGVSAVLTMLVFKIKQSCSIQNNTPVFSE